VLSVNNATEKSRQIMKKQTKTLRSENVAERAKKQKIQKTSKQQQQQLH
jgi:hypothetical protein